MELSGRSGYQGLDPADMEPIQVLPPPHHYAGLSNEAPGAGLDPHGYTEIIADPEYGDHPQVCMETHHQLRCVTQFFTLMSLINN